MKKDKPFKEGFVKTKYHKVHYSIYGNPNGTPWLFCHGGPGYRCVPDSNLKFFDLKKDMVILMDQRGAGESKPSAELRENSTQHLIKDMEQILTKLKISKINILGSSWGTTLALVFAIHNPTMVKSLVLKSVFLGRKKDIWNIYKPSPLWTHNQLEKYKATLGVLKKEFGIQNFLIDGEKILKKKNKDSVRFAKLWASYEDLICSKKWEIIDFDADYLKIAMNISTIEIHYFKNNCFLPVNFILKNAPKISHIPTFVIHGYEDMVCSVNQAHRLQIALNCRSYIDPTGGHASTDRMKRFVKEAVKEARKLNKSN